MSNLKNINFFDNKSNFKVQIRKAHDFNDKVITFFNSEIETLKLVDAYYKSSDKYNYYSYVVGLLNSLNKKL